MANSARTAMHLLFSSRLLNSASHNGMVQEQGKQSALVWWVLWGAFLIGITTIYFVLGAPNPHARPPQDAEIPWLIGAAPFVLSILVRWVVLPKATVAQQGLVYLVLGMAFAETTCLLGLFIFPKHQQELFVLSLLGVIQFLPLYAGRFFPNRSVA